jgi:hypothetical protein
MMSQQRSSASMSDKSLKALTERTAGARSKCCWGEGAVQGRRSGRLERSFRLNFLRERLVFDEV